MDRKEYLRRCAMAAGDMDGKRYRTAKRYLVWCRPARWCGYQAMLPIAYQMRYRKDGTIAHTAIVQETKAHCQHEIPLEKVYSRRNLAMKRIHASNREDIRDTLLGALTVAIFFAAAALEGVLA